jgi:hypothetical protein
MELPLTAYSLPWFPRAALRRSSTLRRVSLAIFETCVICIPLVSRSPKKFRSQYHLLIRAATFLPVMSNP